MRPHLLAALSALLLVRPAVAIDRSHLDAIDAAVNAAIECGQLPGAVVLVLHQSEVVHRKAYGQRSKDPAAAMTVDTVFDLASLTKPLATAVSVHLLVEQGKLRLDDPAAKHWPAFGQNGKEHITLLDLLLHTGGLIADNPMSDYKGGRDEALDRVSKLKPLAEPGQRFVYSDVGYIVLGEVVRRVSAKPVDEFARQHFFDPLGMSDTTFHPGPRQIKRTAPTERRDGNWIVGEVHDPRAQVLGVAGHAGLFSTVDDLAVYARMLLAGGVHNGKRVLAPETVRALTRSHTVPGGLRTPGFDSATAYSANRGERFPRGTSYGHTGFTGTSIWIDPGSQTAVIFLSNRVHPDGKGDVTRLRGRVATLAAAAVGVAAPASDTGVSTGIDVLARENFARLKGRRVGLVTNHSGRDRKGRATIDLLHKAPGVTLVALYSPEHGIRGALDEKVSDTKDEATGLPVYSLYGDRRKPTAELLKGVDTLVYDIQDAGCRFYTYISTLGLVMEAAAENKVKVVVLDRPNPLGGLEVDGPLLDPGRESFVAFHKLPVRHGLTVGELARLFNAERKTRDGKPITCDLEVVKMEGWKRGDLFDATGVAWVHPSPNLRSLTAALLYPGIGLLETTNLSVGRGTDRPFEWVGAPWIDERKLASALRAEGLPGLRVVPLRLTPSSSVHKGQSCGGVELIVDDWARFRPLRTGLTLACVLRRLYPNDWKPDRYDVLLGHKATWEGVKSGKTAEQLERAWQADLARFREQRRPHLLYD